MSVKQREEFLKWHAEQEGNLFNFREEMYQYCKSDVDIEKMLSKIQGPHHGTD